VDGRYADSPSEHTCHTLLFARAIRVVRILVHLSVFMRVELVWGRMMSSGIPHGGKK